MRLFHKKERPYSYLSELLGYQPKDSTLYEKALTHRSMNGESNERLEYLGDAMISLVVAEELYKLYPEEGEGFLTRARSKAVCRDNLNRVARQAEIDRHLHIAVPMKRNSENIYGNALEALVGAIYLDAGYAAARQYIRRVIVGSGGCNLKRWAEQETDFKSRLLELSKAKHAEVEFLLVDERYVLQDDIHVFLYEVLWNGTTLAQAAGHTKIEAQQSVSKKALKALNSDKKS